jgi:hypothetical protein
MNYSNTSKGLLTVLPSISTWDSGQSFLISSRNAYAQSSYLGESTVTFVFKWDLPDHWMYTKRRCQNYSSACPSSLFIKMTYSYLPLVHLTTTYDNSETSSSDSSYRNNLQVNIKKSSFCAFDTEYLGFILTREGIKPRQQKVSAILQVAPPCNVKQV